MANILGVRCCYSLTPSDTIDAFFHRSLIYSPSSLSCSGFFFDAAGYETFECIDLPTVAALTRHFSFILWMC